MPLEVYVAIWHLDTRAGDTLSWFQKASNLRDQIDLADQHFKSLGSGTNAFKIFVAPEYYFADFSNGKDLIVGYTDGDKQSVVAQLLGMSNDFADTLILGGTVAWKVQLGRADRDNINQQLKLAKAQVLQLQPTGQSTPWHTEVEQARQNIRLKGWDVKGKLTGQAKLRWFGFNAAFACFNGNLLEEIRKSTNAMEFSGENPNDNVVMVPGTSAGTFAVDKYKGVDGTTDLKVGVEICGDHGRIGQFRENVDIHILLSASQSPGSTYAVANGIFIHCDSKNPPRVERSVPLGQFFDRQKIKDTANTVADTAQHLYCQKVTLGT